jgi:hypothetical protein
VQRFRKTRLATQAAKPDPDKERALAEKEL